MYEARTLGSMDDSKYKVSKMTKKKFIEVLKRAAKNILSNWETDKNVCDFENFEDYLEYYNIKKGTHIHIRNIETKKEQRIMYDSEKALQKILKMKESDINV